MQNDVTPTTEPTITAIHERIGPPMLLFLGVFAGLLALSTIVFLPRFTRVQVQGELLDGAQLSSYAATITAEVAAAEQKRDAYIRPLREPLYLSLLLRKGNLPRLLLLEQEVSRIAAHITEEGTVFIEEFSHDLAAQTLTIRGDVRGVGPRSMTVLASFVDALGTIPGIDSFASPAFVRDEHPIIGFHSPFVLTLRLLP